MQAKYFSYIFMIDPVVQRMAGRGAGVIINIVGTGGKVSSRRFKPIFKVLAHTLHGGFGIAT